MMSSQEIREKFLLFFKEKEHAIIPSSSIVPENDPSVLFTTAGMHPLVPYLLGEPHPEGKRLANFQKCVRTVDIDRVGNQWHLTFFEMLGNWSFGDYFKKGAIEMSLEFLTSKKWMGLDAEKIYISVFKGDKDAKRDEESANIWKSLGIPDERIYYFPKSDNWWGPAGQTGPCGPCTEMFYDVGKEYCKKPGRKLHENCNPGCSCGKYAEIWNDVFMEYHKTVEGKFVQLKQKNVDTGLGLERMAAVMQGKDNVYETDLMIKTFNKVKELVPEESFLANIASARIITDHMRAAAFILGDEIGIVPSNVDQGYVLRRLIRRAVRHGRILGINSNFTAEVAKTVIERFKEIYPELKKNKSRILDELDREETKFRNVVAKGLLLLEREIVAAEKKRKKEISPKTSFDLYQSFGFPIEITEEIATEKGLSLDREKFLAKLRQHQQLSRKATEKKFKGGLADTKAETTRLHTATHLLNEALRRAVDKKIYQKGSNITAERLRFDFPLNRKLTKDEIKKVEELVNRKIKEGLEVKMETMSLSDAKKAGAEGVFAAKYGERVKIYTMLNRKTKEIFSREICGGPHVKNTKGLGKFRIVKEEGVAAGVRRIKAVLE